MGITTILLLSMAVLLVAGVAFSLVAGARRGAGTPPSPAPLGVFWAVAVPAIGFAFYLAGGYVWLAGLAGQRVAEMAFWALSVVAPVLGAAVCLWQYIKSGARLRWFLPLWGCVLVTIVGVGAMGIGNM